VSIPAEQGNKPVENTAELAWKLEAKDDLPNANRTQAAERAEKCRFLSLMTLTFDLWHRPSNSSEWGIKHFFRVNLSQIRSAVHDIFHTQQKTTDWRRQKQNLPQVTACGNNYFLVCTEDHRPIFAVNLCSVKSIAFLADRIVTFWLIPQAVCSVCDIDVLCLYAPTYRDGLWCKDYHRKTRNSYSVLDCNPNLPTEKEAYPRKWSVEMGKFSFLARPRSAIPAATELW